MSHRDSYGSTITQNGSKSVYLNNDATASTKKKTLCIVLVSVGVVLVLGIIAVVVGVVVSQSQTKKSKTQHSVEYDTWDSLLKKYVSAGKIDGVDTNVVDYCSLKKDAEFETVLSSWKDANTESFTANELLAFYVNAYNIFAIKTVIDHGKLSDKTCLKGIRDVGFDIPYEIAGKTITLAEIEANLRDPQKAGWQFEEDCRIHGSIVCASVSCPNLSQDAYTPSKVREQMSNNVKDWLSNSGKGSNITNSELVLSKIFSFFPEDFNKTSCGGGVVNFVQKYAPANVVNFIETKRNKDSTWSAYSFFTTPTQSWPGMNGTTETGYNWNLNGQAPCKC